jgi:hypothetical protein
VELRSLASIRARNNLDLNLERPYLKKFRDRIRSWNSPLKKDRDPNYLQTWFPADSEAREVATQAEVTSEVAASCYQDVQRLPPSVPDLIAD